MDDAAPLQPAREEADALDHARGIADVDLTEIVLAELARHALEPDQRGDGRRPQPAHQFVDGALAAPYSCSSRSRRRISTPGSAWSSCSQVSTSPVHGRGDRRAADPPRRNQRGRLARGDRGLVLDAAHTAYGDVGRRGDRLLGHLRCTEDLDLMPAHGVDHPFPFPGAVASRAAPGKSLSALPETGQLFRKGRGRHSRIRGSKSPMAQIVLGQSPGCIQPGVRK